ncbi:MAG TPA: tail fiber domain-containing protein [Chitinophagaceae bacterium]|nr:tail fiber domain-containing protein [Chitinophagaceae bacterium]
MKKFFLLTSTSYFFLICHSQNVGIGTSSPQNKLHVAGGFRLDTLTSVGGAGLMTHDGNGVVYGIKFTGSSGDVLRGDGTFGAGASTTSWSLTGNAGTDPSTNFIGTTDAQPLFFKVNNSLAGHIDLASNNTAFGLGSLPSGTTGVTNAAFGFNALSANTTGYANTAQGHGALIVNTTGNQNTAVGTSALSRNTIGTQNTAVGVTALFSNYTGSNNTAIGFGADVTTDGLVNATAVGYNAKVGQSNSLVLGNGANVGIGTSSPQSMLHLTGSFRMDTVSNGADSGILRHDKNGVVYSLKFTGVATDVLRGDGTFGSGGSGAVGWLLSGNSGTNPASQFLGTSDAEPLLFRVNNITAGQIQLSNTNTGFGLGTLANATGNFNTAVGNYALYSNTTGDGNTSVGEGSMYSNTTGRWNTAHGDDALYSNTTGGSNTGIGNSALYANTTGNSNTATGTGALLWNTTGSSNTSVGTDALRNNTTASGNTASGFESLYSNNTGSGNTATGYSSLKSNTTGNTNTANGYTALYSNTTGYNNVGVGYTTLYSNTSGYSNTATGYSALHSNTTGYLNTANGYFALNSNTTGTYNSALGNGALTANTTGSYNVATGASALGSSTTGLYNTADGYQAAASNTTAWYNTAIGVHALYSNSTSHYNTAVGANALYYNTEYYNTAVGFGTLFNTTASQYNTAIGSQAGSNYNNGYNNVFVGANADVNGNDYYDVIAIGQGTTCTAPEQARIGNTFITSIGGQVGWTTFSDARYKKNIKEDVPGLAFINKLRPVTYNLDATALDNFLHRNQSKDKQMDGNAKARLDKALKEKEQMKLTGFVAQEVEKSAKELGFDFSGVDAPKNSNDVYGLRYSDFVVPLVKAMQEQQKIIEDQNEKIDTQQQQIVQQQQQIDLLIKDMSALKAKINH